MVGDTILTNQDEKEQATFDFYNNLLGAAEQRDFSIDLEQLGILARDLQDDLDEFFTEEEVWTTLKSLPSDKAPGPYGYTDRFYKSCWQIIESGIMAALIVIHCGNVQNLWMLNSTFVTLIPKKEVVDQMKNFRPISLIHGFAKLVTKIMANRLSKKLNEMVSTNPSAFIKGRCIQDNFLLVQQTTKYLHQQKLSHVLLKLDITKAFDSMSWLPFLLEILKHWRFRNRWFSTISSLLYSSSTKVLLNGSPGEEIYHQRGLRQGDPLSPMLFILVMNVLNALVQKASDGRLLQPLARRPLQHRVSLYVDDVVLFLRQGTI